MKNKTQEILKQVLPSIEVVEDDKLYQFMEASINLETEELIALLLEVIPKIKTTDLKRIIRYIPEDHQLTMDLLLSLMDETEETKKLSETMVQTEQELVETLKIFYQNDTTIDKSQYKDYLATFKPTELSLILANVKGQNQTEFTALTTRAIKSLQETQKAKH
jgi:hypothetical protein